MEEKGFKLPDWVPTDLWEEWFEWRKKRKFPTTDRVKRHCIRMLEDHRRMGYTAETVLLTAIVRGWRDLWEPKEQPNGVKNLNMTTVIQSKPTMSDEELEAIKRESERMLASFKKRSQ